MGKLFSRSSKSSDAKSDNPYAQSPASQDPYAGNSSKTSMSSYSNKSAPGLPSGPRSGLPTGPRSGAPVPRPSPSQQPPAQQPPPSYGSSVSGGYGPNKYGSGGGYGANRYQNEQSFQQNQNAPVTSQPFRPGGYGGLGRMDSSSTDVNRGDLFGGARDRYDPPRGNAYASGNPPGSQTKPVTGYGQPGASAAESGSYGGYGEPRELTEEEQEEQKIQDIMAETSAVRGDTKAATSRILHQMYDTVDVGNDTLARLGAQGESLHNADKNMDKAENHNVRGYDKAKELQTVNRSMFAVHVSNPFTAKKRAQANDEAVMERHRQEKSQREATRAAHYSEAHLMGNTLESRIGGLRMDDRPPSFSKDSKKKNPYVFAEEDEEENETEKAINDDLDEMYHVAGILKGQATKSGQVLDKHNEIINRIAAKTDRVDDGVRRNRHELDKVR